MVPRNVNFLFFELPGASIFTKIGSDLSHSKFYTAEWHIYDILGFLGFFGARKSQIWSKISILEQNRPIFDVLRNFPGHQVVGSSQKWLWTFILVKSTNLSWGFLRFWFLAILWGPKEPILANFSKFHKIRPLFRLKNGFGSK